MRMAEEEVANSLAFHNDRGCQGRFVINLSRFIQTAVLATVVRVFFPEVRLPVEDAAVVAEKINMLWVLSKSCEDSRGDEIKREKRVLFGILDRCFGQEEENPLAVVLPAYETLWRVVLRVILELRFRSTPSSDIYIQEFSAYLYSPSAQTFSTPSQGGEVSVSDVMSEALRLYPPTRRIYRSLSPSSHIAADVEGVQRDPRVWGEDAEVFRPGREWRDHGFWAFGGGSFRCVGMEFAPRFAAVLVGAVLGVVGEEAVLREDGEMVEGEGLPLKNGRGCYEGVVVEW